MEELNIEFNNYINEFKKLDTNLKLKQIVNSLRELVAFIDLLALEKNIKLDYLKSKEISDLNKPDVSQDDYLEAILVYIEVTKELLAQYLEQTSSPNSNDLF